MITYLKPRSHLTYKDCKADISKAKRRSPAHVSLKSEGPNKNKTTADEPDQKEFGAISKLADTTTLTRRHGSWWARKYAKCQRKHKLDNRQDTNPAWNWNVIKAENRSYAKRQRAGRINSHMYVSKQKKEKIDSSSRACRTIVTKWPAVVRWSFHDDCLLTYS